MEAEEKVEDSSQRLGALQRSSSRVSCVCVCVYRDQVSVTVDGETYEVTKDMVEFKV